LTISDFEHVTIQPFAAELNLKYVKLKLEEEIFFKWRN
jgi:hypothetical protein